MPPDSAEQDDDPDTEFAEIDPTRRYGRVSLFHISTLTLNSLLHSLFSIFISSFFFLLSNSNLSIDLIHN